MISNKIKNHFTLRRPPLADLLNRLKMKTFSLYNLKALVFHIFQISIHSVWSGLFHLRTTLSHPLDKTSLGAQKGLFQKNAH